MSTTPQSSPEGRRNIDTSDIEGSLQHLRDTIPGWGDTCDTVPNFEEEARRLIAGYAVSAAEGDRVLDTQVFILDMEPMEVLSRVAELCRQTRTPVAAPEIDSTVDDLPEESSDANSSTRERVVTGQQAAAAARARLARLRNVQSPVTRTQAADQPKESVILFDDDDASGAEQDTAREMDIPAHIIVAFGSVRTYEQNIASIREASGEHWGLAEIAMLSSEEGSLEERVRTILSLYIADPEEGLAELNAVGDQFPNDLNVQYVLDVMHTLCEEAANRTAEQNTALLEPEQTEEEDEADAEQATQPVISIADSRLKKGLIRRAEAVGAVDPEAMKGTMRTAGEQMIADAESDVAFGALRDQFAILQSAIATLSTEPNRENYTAFSQAIHPFIETVRQVTGHESVRRNDQYRKYADSMIKLVMDELGELTRVFTPQGSKLTLIGPSIIQRSIVDNNARGIRNWSHVERLRHELAAIRSQLLQVRPAVEKVARAVEVASTGASKVAARIGNWQSTTRGALAIMLYAGLAITAGMKMFGGGTASESKTPDKKPATSQPAEDNSSKKIPKSDSSDPSRASSDTPAPNTESKTPTALSPKEKAVKIATGIQSESIGRKVYLKFSDMQDLEVGKTIMVFFGDGTLQRRSLSRQTDGRYVFDLKAGEDFATGELAIGVKEAGKDWAYSNQD